MRTAVKTVLLLGVILLPCNWLWGCANTAESLTVPIDVPDSLGTTSNAESQRVLWGMWNIHIDASKSAVTFEPIRNPQAHFNITDMILPPACEDCLDINVNSFDLVTRILDADITLRNPYAINGYDVRGILYTNDYGHQLLNTDAWTGLWDVISGLDINPFKAFAKDENQRVFTGSAVHTENYTVYIPKPPQWGAITFAVDASWPGNCKEPYAIDNIGPLSGLFDTSTGMLELQVEVRDWQDDVDQVFLEAPEITGEVSTQFTHMSDDIWNLMLMNKTEAPEGDYEIKLTATSVKPNDLPLYDLFTITIKHKLGWADTWGGDAFVEDKGFGVATDGSNYVYATGYHQMGASPLALDVFLRKYTIDGNLVNHFVWGGNGTDVGYGVTVDGAGDVYVTGVYQYTVDFDPGPGVDEHPANYLYTEMFLSKLDSSGEYQWARTWGGNTSTGDESYGVAADNSGNIYVTGNFTGSAVDFDPGPEVYELSTNGGNDIFLCKYDSTGDFQWAHAIGGESGETGYSVAVDGYGNAFVTGAFAGIIDLDPGPDVDEHISTGWADIFVVKFSPGGNFQWARTWGGEEYDDNGYSVTVDSLENVYITGFFTGTVDFDPGPGIDEHTDGGAFLSKFNSDGNFLYALTWGGTGRSVATDDLDKVYVTGNFDGKIDFDPGPEEDWHTNCG